jgi:apolipoprotein N-acyltransferase
MLAVFPVVAVAEEWLRGHIFTGLPWTPLGSLLLDTPAIGWAAVVGVYGAALLPAWLAASLTYISDPVYWRYGLVSGLLAVVLFIAAPAPHHADGEVQHVALVQANIPQDVKWDAAFLTETMRRYARASDTAAARNDLIIWPEAAVPFFLERVPDWRKWLNRKMLAWGVPLLFGGLKLKADGRQANNGLYLFNPDAPAALSFAGKRHLVPFGEYVPSWIPFLHKLVPNIADFRPAHDSGVLSDAHGRYGSLVCYEAIFPEEARHRVQEGATVLINVTNDAWYGKTPAAWQHLQAARMRAVETGRYLLRAANTGITAIIRPDGSVSKRMDWFEQGVVTGEFRHGHGYTPYQRWEDWPLLLLFVVLAVPLRRQWRNAS